MKKLLIVAALLASTSVFAGTIGGVVPILQQDQTSVSNSDAAANNAGNVQQIVFESGAGTTDVTVAEVNGKTARDVAARNADVTVRNTPSVSGPPLVSSNDTCMGSASGAVNAPGIGVAFGKTYTDDNCVMLKNSREMWNMGMKAAALARMCMNSDNRDSLEMTGFVCAQTERDQKLAAAGGTGTVTAQPTNVQYTDPIVRARLGMAPLPTARK